MKQTDAKCVRFIMIGGFLGAGKTTTIGRLASAYIAQGKRVAIVTNDQSEDLVDTHALAAQGFRVGEVPGACFCCRFEDLIDTIRGLTAEQVPDIILAEPVGSCTDLVATVIEPLRRYHATEFQTATYGVLLKPEHGLKILSADQQRGFSPEAEYIFLKQLEEAQLIVINKIDKLSEDDLEFLMQNIKRRYPSKQTICISARHGTGVDRLLTELSAETPDIQDFMEIDYDRYATGEAELGWLNASYTMETSPSIQVDQWLQQLMQTFQRHFRDERVEAAHVKVLAKANDKVAVANLVSTDAPAELSVPSLAVADQLDLIVNARAATHPKLLEDIVAEVIGSTTDSVASTVRCNSIQAFRPGRPVPTHCLR